jgi:hypothetical protein
VNICHRVSMHAELFVELGVEASAYIDSAKQQPRGNRGIVVHRCERIKLANRWPATVGGHG